MAKRSSVSASASTSAPKRKRSGGHKVGYDPAWKSTYPWLVPVESDGTIVGLQCQWCTTHSSERQRSRSGIWTTSPCTSLRKDCIERHSNSEVHARSAELELNREQAVRDGGIVMAFQQQVVAQRKAVIGALKVVYWLAKAIKHDVTPCEFSLVTTTFTLFTVASMGPAICTYLSPP